MRTTEWVIGAVAFAAGVLAAGFAMVGTGLTLLWSGFDPTDGAGRPWWLWLLLPAPPVLMLAAGLVARRAGATGPVVLGVAGAAGVVTGVAYAVLAGAGR